MKAVLAFFALAFCALASGQRFIYIDGAGGGGGGPSYLLALDFEESGAPASLAQSNGTPSYDYTTAPAPLAGSESMQTNGSFEHGTFLFSVGGESDVWVYVLVNSTAGGGGGSASAGNVQLLTSSDVVQASLSIGTDRLQIGHGSAASTSLGASNSATTAYWLHYVAESVPGSSADGTLTLYATKNSAPGSRPAALMTITTGTGDAVHWIRLTCWNTSTAFVFDEAYVSASEITGVP